MEQFASSSLSILKFVSIALTAILSAIALLVDYKDEKGNITYWGKRALIGIVVGAVIAASSTALEIEKGEKESAKNTEEALFLAKRTNKILNNINRSLFPLKNLEFSFLATVDLSSKDLEPFKSRFSKEIDSYLSQYLQGKRNYEGMYASHSDQNGPVEISVPLGTKSFPHEHEETMAYYLIRHVDFHLKFYKNPISPTYFEEKLKKESEYKKPDLRIDMDTSEQDQFGISLDYNVNDKSFRVNGSSINSDSRYWETNSKIISLPDLKGSQLFVFTGSINVPSIKNDNSKLVSLRGGVRLDTLIINIAGGQEFWLRTKELKEYKTPRGLKYFVFSFPNGIEEYVR